VVLNPYEKWAFFDGCWKARPEWLTEVKKKVLELWEEYSITRSSTIQPPAIPPLHKLKDYRRPDYLARFRERLYATEQEEEQLQNEYSRYYGTGRVRPAAGM
jgi:hypothetical protein